jgi:hypothetical protein
MCACPEIDPAYSASALSCFAGFSSTAVAVSCSAAELVSVEAARRGFTIFVLQSPFRKRGTLSCYSTDTISRVYTQWCNLSYIFLRILPTLCRRFHSRLR